MIRVLIVEDSPVEQALLAHILGSDPEIQVAGIACDGEQAIAEVERIKPDVVTMDIHMPKLNGFETTRRLMEEHPLPIVIVSGSFSRRDTHKTFRAMEAGALAVVRKPHGIGHPLHQENAGELIRIVKIMSEVRVVRRWSRLPGKTPASLLPVAAPEAAHAKIQIVAIGASTGGPAVLQAILSALPRNLSAPLLIVQHMAAGFMENFVRWISASSGFPARIALHGEYPVPGYAYFAPDGFHMLLGRDRRIVLSAEAPENGLRPSVSRLFRSVAEAFGCNAMGILLTGMGRDGADDLKLLRTKGALTVAQDEESSIIFGMPGEAAKLDAAEYILPPEKIAGLLAQLLA